VAGKEPRVKTEVRTVHSLIRGEEKTWWWCFAGREFLKEEAAV